MGRSAFCRWKHQWNRVAACPGGFADLAQLVEQRPQEPWVVGSYPTACTTNAKTAAVVCERRLRPGSFGRTRQARSSQG